MTGRRSGEITHLSVEDRHAGDHERVVLELVATLIAVTDRAAHAVAVTDRLAKRRVLRVCEESNGRVLPRLDREGRGSVEGARIHPRVEEAVVRHIVRAAHHVLAPPRGRPQRIEAWTLGVVPRIVARATKCTCRAIPPALPLKLADGAVVRAGRVRARVAAVELGAVSGVERVAHGEARCPRWDRRKDKLSPCWRGESRCPMSACTPRVELEGGLVETRAAMLAAGAASWRAAACASSACHHWPRSHRWYKVLCPS